MLLRLLLIELHSKLDCSIQRRPSGSLLRETFPLLSGLLFFDRTADLNIVSTSEAKEEGEAAENVEALFLVSLDRPRGF